MNVLELKSIRELVLRSNEKVYQGENKIISFDVVLPEKIGDYATAECDIEMRCYLGDNYIPFEISTASRKTSTKVTSDITETAQTVQILFYITHGDDVIGKTNKVDLIVYETKAGTPIDPRSELDEIIREQRETIAEQAETITTQGETISQQSLQITELNGEVTELQGEVAEQAATITRQNTTIDELNRRVPPLQTLDPINPTTEQVTYNPESPNIGFPQVIVNAPTAEGLGFDYGTLKKDVEFLGGVGTYDPFPYNSVGGIYILSKNEDDIPEEYFILNWDNSGSSFVLPINQNIYKVALKKVVFENCKNITFLQYAFANCTSLKEVALPDSFRSLTPLFFQNCYSLNKVVLGNQTNTIADWCFDACGELREINMPASLVSVGQYWSTSPKLEIVTLGENFNCSLNLSSSALYSHDTILSWFNALADRTGETAYTLTIGTTNLNKMTAEEKAIATNKNWNLA